MEVKKDRQTERERVKLCTGCIDLWETTFVDEDLL